MVNRTFLIAALTALVFASAPVTSALTIQSGAAQGSINLPSDELKAYGPVKAARTPDEAFTAAAAFTAKYPKSAALVQIPYDIAATIDKAPMDASRLAMVEKFKTTFPGHELGLQLDRRMADYYLAKGDLGTLMKVCDAYLGKHPDDTRTHYLMLRVAVDALKKSDNSHLASGREHGAKAIAALESPTRPVDFETDAEWTTFKNESLGPAYQSFGLIALVTGDSASANTYITKATLATPADPFNFLLLANARYSGYEAAAKAYNAKIDKKTDEAKKLLTAAETELDKVLEALVKAVALSEGKPELAGVMTQSNSMLEEHWKQRYGKLDGLADAIKAAKPKP